MIYKQNKANQKPKADLRLSQRERGARDVVFVSKVINQSERITGDLSHKGDFFPNAGLHLAVHTAAGEAVEASGFIGEGGADPRLDVTHVPQEIPTSCST